MVIEGRLEKIMGKHTKELTWVFSPGKKWDPYQFVGSTRTITTTTTSTVTAKATIHLILNRF